MNIKKILNPTFQVSKLDNCDYLIIDIETTGFSREYCEIILIGIVHYDSQSDQLYTYQIFKDALLSETELLKTFFKIINTITYDYIFTYNGHNFDIPFINARCSHLGISNRLGTHRHVDIYRIVKKYYTFFQLPNYKLKTIEKFLSIHREDTISGKESVELYKQYLSNPSDELIDTILLHNYEDVINMVPLLKILDYDAIKESDWNVKKSIYPNHADIHQPVLVHESNSFYFNHWQIKNNQMTITLSSNMSSMKNQTYYHQNGTIVIDQNNIVLQFYGDFADIDDHTILALNLNNLSNYDIAENHAFLSLLIDNQLIWDHLVHLCHIIQDII